MTPLIACYDADTLRAIETRAARRLGDAGALMQSAGHAAWRAVLSHWPAAQRLVVVCGPGDNGGDGYAFAMHALQAGRDVRVSRLRDHAPRSAPARHAEQRYLDAGGRIGSWNGDRIDGDLIVDALFGIGLSRAPQGDVATLIDAINASNIDVFAIDVPSGVDADRGCAPGSAVVATRTLQMMAAHPGLATGDGAQHAGQRSVACIGLTEADIGDATAAACLMSPTDIDGSLRPRRRNAHKGDSGRVVCIGGDHGKGGAMMLCAEAALRSGAGLVDAVTRAAHVPALLAHRAEIMAHDADGEGIEQMIDVASVVAIGPGLGQDGWGQRLWSMAVASGKPLVIDADALNLLAMRPVALRADSVLTPHPGEAGRLLGMEGRSVQADRYAAVHALRDRYGCTVVLKGAGTLVASAWQITRVIDAGNPGMAVGGMGDVLTGVIAALRAQGLSHFEAASRGALLHAVAGDLAADDGGQRGLLPSDLFAQLRGLVNR